MENYTLSVLRDYIKGKAFDILSWEITLLETPVSVVIEYSINNLTYDLLYEISPEDLNGQHTTRVTANTKKYRLKIIKADNTVVYSDRIVNDISRGHEHCDFGIVNFNTTKRDKKYVESIIAEEKLARGQGGQGGPKKTQTPTPTLTRTPTNSLTPTNTPTSSVTTTPTISSTSTAGASSTPTPTLTNTTTVTQSNTPTTSNTPTNTPTITKTGTNTPTVTKTTTATPTHLNNPGVLLLDFDGYYVSGTSWNTNGDINCDYSGLSLTEQDTVIATVTAYYTGFNVIVTTDESVYYNAPTNRRIRCVITETWEWYGSAGGVAFVGSFSWGDNTNTPCFVFSSLLSYNLKNIADATAHELGHTLGCRHQSVYDSNCVKTSEYNYGEGCCGPIMGASYSRPTPQWWVGPSSICCTCIQDDTAVIKNTLGQS